MPAEPPATSDNRALTAQIVAAYVRRNQIAANQMTALISTVYKALADRGKPTTEAEAPRTPAVLIRQSARRDYVVCLDCGWKGQMLRRHVTTAHGLTAQEYRARWKLPADHPLTATGYSERQSTMAKQLGLGRARASGEITTVPEAAAETTPPASLKRRGRPRTPKADRSTEAQTHSP